MSHKYISLFLSLFFLLGCSSLSSLSVSGVRDNSDLLRPAWFKNIDPIYNTGNLPIAVHGPVIFQGILFAGTDEGEMVAYHLADGRELWREKDNGGYHSRPVVYNNKLLYGTRQGRVYARDYLSGQLIYSVDLDAAIESPAVVHEGRMFFHLRNHKIFSMDVETGKILWAYRRSVPFLTTMHGVSVPKIHEGRLIVGFADGAIVALGLEDGVVIWEARIDGGGKFVDVDLDPFIFNGQLLSSSVSSELHLIDPLSGQMIRRVELNLSRSPFKISDQRVLAGTTTGQVKLLDRHLGVLNTLDLGHSHVTNILPWKGGYLITLAENRLFWIDAEVSESREVFDLGHAHSGVLGHATADEGFLSFISSRHRLYVFK